MKKSTGQLILCRVAVTFISSKLVGNTNAFKYGGPRAPSGQFSGIPNINFSKQKVRRFECETMLDPRCTAQSRA